MSDGTIEIEGFGFDTISEFGDDSSVWGGESLCEGSVYDGQEGSGEVDISRRAEKVLASAKRKLDLCGQNISRARSSLVLSPSATPNALLEHLDAVGPVVRRRAESAGGAHSQQWRYNNARAELEDRGAAATGSAHARTASESAVANVHTLGTGRSFGDLKGLSDLPEDPRETDKQQSARTVNRCNSAQQMRALRDQMKDLRGKITTLQEQTKTVKGRQSASSLRSSSTVGSGSEDTTPQWPPVTLNLEDIRESRVLDVHTTIEQEWEHVSTRRPSSQYSVDGSDRSGTPTGPRRSDVNSPDCAHQDVRSDAFSYDSYLFRKSFFKDIRPASMSSDGESTATATLPLVPPRPLERKDSFVSISSYATADEDQEVSARTSPNLAGLQANPLLHPRAPTGTPTIPGGWLTASSTGDDGYHSAPHTPRVDKELPQTPSDEPPPPAAASSWYRESVDTMKTQSMLIYEDDPDVMGGGAHGGGMPLTIATSARDSQTMVVGGMGVGGKEEIELKIGRSDRVLIEGVIEALGRVCCAMETEGERSRSDLRDRLREAMRVLEGDDGEMF